MKWAIACERRLDLEIVRSNAGCFGPLWDNATFERKRFYIFYTPAKREALEVEDASFPGARKEEGVDLLFFLSSQPLLGSSDLQKKKKKTQAGAKAAATLLTKYRGDAQLTAVRAFCLQQMGQGGEAVQVRVSQKSLACHFYSGRKGPLHTSSSPFTNHIPPPPLPLFRNSPPDSSPAPPSRPLATRPAPTRWGSPPES